MLLGATRRGVATRCSCCGKVEVEFGNALLSLDAAELDHLLSCLGGRDLAQSPDFSDRRGYVIRCGPNGPAYVFSRAEIVELRELLVQARRVLQAENGHPSIPSAPHSQIVH